MQDRSLRCSRRKFLARAAGLTFAGGIVAGSAAGQTPAGELHTRPPQPGGEGRRPIALVCTVYRSQSYACLLAERFLHGYPRDGRLHVPPQQLCTVHVDQTPVNDLSRHLGREFGIHVTRSIPDALTRGTGRLAVEGVLLVGEHGNYPRNDRGQILYPRYEMMEQIVSVFRQTGQSVPVFNAKHLSYRWDRCRQMAAWADKLGFPLLAGGTVPVTWRRPELELSTGGVVEEALVAAYGPTEVYGFDALDALQAMVERRRGGESGVRAVTCLSGPAVWKAGDEGRWSWDLLEAALARSETVGLGDVRHNVGRVAVGNMPAAPPVAFLVEYRDGLRGAVLLLNGHLQDFCFAARVQGEDRPLSCSFHQPGLPGAKHFDRLAATIEQFFATGRPPYPKERALLTSGALEAVMDSHHQRGTRIETPQLAFPYTASEKFAQT
jgi:hypothetical protein